MKTLLMVAIFPSPFGGFDADRLKTKYGDIVRARPHIHLSDAECEKKRVGQDVRSDPRIQLASPTIDVHVRVEAARLLQLDHGLGRRLMFVQWLRSRCEESEGVEMSAHDGLIVNERVDR